MLDGEVAAAILGNDMPKDPRVRTLVPDPHAAAEKWYRREGIIPIGLGLRPTERERFGPMACARIKTFDPLHAGGFRLCARF